MAQVQTWPNLLLEDLEDLRMNLCKRSSAGGNDACHLQVVAKHSMSWLLDMVPRHEVMQFSIRQVPFGICVYSLGSRFGEDVHVLSMQQSCQTNWTETGFYNKTFARAIINAGKAAMRLGKK